MRRMAATALAVEALRKLGAAGKAEAFDAADYFADELAQMRAAKTARQKRWRNGDASTKASTDASTEASTSASTKASTFALPLALSLSDLRGDKLPGNTQSFLALTPSQPSENPRPNGHPRVRAPLATDDAWRVYTRAYTERYGVPPERNATVNGQMSRFCKRVAAESHAATVEHYMRSANAKYVAAGHSVGCLLQDAEKLRTEALTGRGMTAHQARTADKRAGRGADYDEMLARLDAEDRAGGRV